MTAHVECVALLVPGAGPVRGMTASAGPAVRRSAAASVLTAVLLVGGAVAVLVRAGSYLRRAP